MGDISLTQTHLANPDWVLADVLAAGFVPPPPVDLVQWAKDNIFFDKDDDFPGPFNFDRFPFLVDILRALQPDHPCRWVTLAKSAQSSGTMTANVFTLGTMDLDPTGFLYTHPTNDNALRWVRTKFNPMVRLSPRAGALFPPSGSKEGGASLLYKERRDGRGWLQVSGAGSEASLSLISPRCQVQDDLAKWVTNDAGDPEDQANSRSKAKRNAKIFKVSTPLIAPGCRITAAYEKSSQGQFYVPCPHCGHEHVLTWENLRAATPRGGPEKAAFTCPVCGGLIEQHHRPDMLRRGRWVHRYPERCNRRMGFHIWTAYSPLQTWASIIERHEDAEGDPLKERVFSNDELGLAYQAKGDAPPAEGLETRAQDAKLPRGTVPAGGLLLALGCDCQGDRVEWALWAGHEHMQRTLVEVGVIPHHIREPEARAELDALLARPWRRAAGPSRPADLLAIDANTYTDDVLGWCRSHPVSRVIAVRGVAPDTAPVIELVKGKEKNRRTGKKRRGGGRFFNVGASPIKFGLYEDLAKEDPLQTGYVHFVDGLGRTVFDQLTVEYREAKKQRDGSVKYLWVKPSGSPNEQLDMAVYATAGLHKLGWSTMTPEAWARLAENREPAAAADQGDLEDLLANPATTTTPAAAPSPTKTDRRSLANRLA